MQLRVQLTDGKNYVTLMWISHEGDDVYAGHVGDPKKFSYHGSGKVHFKEPGSKVPGQMTVPLKDLKDYFPITNVSLGSTNAGRGALDDWLYKDSGKKRDSILVIDIRSGLLGGSFSIHVGLLEAGNTDVLQALITGLEPSQVFLATSVTPWICALVVPDLAEKMEQTLKAIRVKEDELVE